MAERRAEALAQVGFMRQAATEGGTHGVSGDLSSRLPYVRQSNAIAACSSGFHRLIVPPALLDQLS